MIEGAHAAAQTSPAAMSLHGVTPPKVRLAG